MSEVELQEVPREVVLPVPPVPLKSSQTDRPLLRLYCLSSQRRK